MPFILVFFFVSQNILNEKKKRFHGNAVLSNLIIMLLALQSDKKICNQHAGATDVHMPATHLASLSL
jgi:hypothetical protein